MIKVFIGIDQDKQYSLRIEGHSNPEKSPEVCAAITILADQCSIVPKVIGDGCVAKVKRDIAFTSILIKPMHGTAGSFIFRSYWEILKKTLEEIQKKYPEQVRVI